jgi:hypothetical protein
VAAVGVGAPTEDNAPVCPSGLLENQGRRPKAYSTGLILDCGVGVFAGALAWRDPSSATWQELNWKIGLRRPAESVREQQHVAPPTLSFVSITSLWCATCVY